MKWQPYLTLMAKRPNALNIRISMKRCGRMEKLFSNCTVQEKKGSITTTSCFTKEHDFEVSTQALRIASQYGHPKVESIKQVFYQLINGRGMRANSTEKTFQICRKPSEE